MNFLNAVRAIVLTGLILGSSTAFGAEPKFSTPEDAYEAFNTAVQNIEYAGSPDIEKESLRVVKAALTTLTQAIQNKTFTPETEKAILDRKTANFSLQDNLHESAFNLEPSKYFTPLANEWVELALAMHERGWQNATQVRRRNSSTIEDPKKLSNADTILLFLNQIQSNGPVINTALLRRLNKTSATIENRLSDLDINELFNVLYQAREPETAQITEWALDQINRTKSRFRTTRI